MRRLPLEPPWLIIPIIALVVTAAAADSILLVYALALLAAMCATMGVDRSFERYRPRQRNSKR
jgi:hypothetical protein